MNNAKQKVIVVGGGIVGLASALALSRHTDDIIVLEAESVLGAHQTGHNSGVIHSGLYYKPGSLKATTCSAGRESMYKFCDQEGIPYRRTGKVVVATSRDELPRLEELRRRGVANGLEGIALWTNAELREAEPKASGLAALWVPQTGIVDYVAVLHAMRRCLERAGVEVRLGSPVRAVRRESGGLTIDATSSAIPARFLVNCAGLQSDRVAKMCGDASPVRIIPFRGEYYLLCPEKAALIKHPIYPVPNPAFPFLGVHLTPRIDGHVEAGPNAVLAFARHGYRTPAFALRDALATIAWPGFWPLGRKHWRTGWDEQLRSWSTPRFVRDLQGLVPDVSEDDVVRAGCGIRAQAVDRQGSLVDDFLVVPGRRTVHVLNAPSPAATASLEIGRLIATSALSHADWH